MVWCVVCSFAFLTFIQLFMRGVYYIYFYKYANAVNLKRGKSHMCTPPPHPSGLVHDHLSSLSLRTQVFAVLPTVAKYSSQVCACESVYVH